MFEEELEGYVSDYEQNHERQVGWNLRKKGWELYGGRRQKRTCAGRTYDSETQPNAGVIETSFTAANRAAYVTGPEHVV